MSQSISPFPEIESRTKLPAKQLNIPTSPHVTKRKRDDGGSNDLQVRKAAKKKKTKKSKAGDDENLDLEQGLNMAIGNFDGRLLADYVAQRQRRFGQDLSIVEMEDRYIPGTALQLLHENLQMGTKT